MPKHASIVIGAGLGDEGKGHYTDILCNKPDTLNIRFNGGGQAAHTVVTPDGKRCVFHHLGSGTFTGAPTFLASTFIINPITFVMEYRCFVEDYNMYPVVFVSPECYVTTVWDMYINQAIETYRNKERHGSCGFGIWETTQRNRFSEYSLRVKDLFNIVELTEKLKLIHNEYVTLRLRNEYGLEATDFDKIPGNFVRSLTESDQLDMFLYFVREFLSIVKVKDEKILDCFDNYVFEGGQGLGLDKENPDCNIDFLTASTTGARNAFYPLLFNNRNCEIDIYYISRPYVTRHGVGPLKHELFSGVPYKRVVDETNVPNQFQGDLRFGYLDFDVLARQIKLDMGKYLIVPSSINLGFTCMDQLDDSVIVGANGELQSFSSQKFLSQAKDYFSKAIPNITGISYTYGLTRDEFGEMK